MKHYKVAILGAGIGGLSLSLYLHLNGIDDFVVLNPMNRSTHKACTGLLVEKTVALLNELGISIDGYKKIKGIYGQYLDRPQVDYAEYNLTLYHHHDVGRTALDNNIYDKALSIGAEIIENCKNIEIDDKNKTVSFNNQKIEYDFVVDARGFYNDINKIKVKDIGFERKFSHSFIDEEEHGTIFFNHSLKGYGWVVYGPYYDIVGFTDEYKKDVDYKKLLDDLVATHYEREIGEYDTKCAYIPVKPTKLYINKSHIQIGDKAGLVDPLTQEGIYFALYSGKMAALAIKNNRLINYKKDMNDIVKCFNFANLIRSNFFKPKYLDKMWDITTSHNFSRYLYHRYSNDLTFFNYKKILKYRKEYKAEKQK